MSRLEPLDSDRRAQDWFADPAAAAGPASSRSGSERIRCLGSTSYGSGQYRWGTHFELHIERRATYLSSLGIRGRLWPRLNNPHRRQQERAASLADTDSASTRNGGLRPGRQAGDGGQRQGAGMSICCAT
ncbi:hypothetical protein GGTG_01174 [Gaeumannomyces tritici R3-111a-1]|uniref:Uncharacterized protein n=1 Tax=Gaeumannomyces tritici (strain R3-111a-1) TaxID=644352 RepID=J3NIU0_GAET3|nr:hypothetical protein GGTG_01174 [Gaeumannomyces tritici R3-111a-1]EJT81190.1 hypothetical protein GGTG_01174 [Gaeumannomyces tritici R3-111a-1]